MDDPEETKNEIRGIYKQKLPHLEAASGELAPIFGLGDGQLATQRAQGLFKHPAFLGAFVEFADNYLDTSWDLPVGEWAAVRGLVGAKSSDSIASWAEDAGPDRKEWEVNHFYARFIVRTLHGIREPAQGKTHLVYWLEDAEEDQAYWVLFHALMYLQLETMRDYKKKAPVKDRFSHFIDMWKKTPLV
ncbi:uncharacterized protein GGS25DRAFT_507496 [Hypoxylon fragiforme]|uniref:uncharacterized protein n=1 Tax=Hypoxylon fragiforme TaxID=63214 RepID=UPI0020C64003|nr:uncharacterized protein GGS25DRAFT_507496 [Hypoxylon fragiforme]KAI2604248.1 hypothetical protein GGS25DRAFT_507496 [Hypoxylon fragiforme]